MRRIAVIFDESCRPDTTGVYCRRALHDLAGSGRIQAVSYVLPRDLQVIQPDSADLFLYIDDGLTTAIPTSLRPSAWWAIDTHLNFPRCLKLAREADVTFAAQRDGADLLRQAGITSARWLPLACDPAIHGRRPVQRRFDVSFVGHVVSQERQRLLELIRRAYPNSFLGRCHFTDMAAIYSASAIAFNASIANDVNMRVFEALCGGALLVTNDLSSNGLSELFQPDTHLVTYRSDDELLDRLDFYLRHSTPREHIAAAGRAEVVAQHTYVHRMETILSTVQSTAA